MKKYFYSLTLASRFYLTIKTATFPQSLLTLFINWDNWEQRGELLHKYKIHTITYSDFRPNPLSLHRICPCTREKKRKQKRKNEEMNSSEIWMEEKQENVDDDDVEPTYSLSWVELFSPNLLRLFATAASWVNVNFNSPVFTSSYFASCTNGWCRWQLFFVHEIYCSWLNEAERENEKSCNSTFVSLPATASDVVRVQKLEEKNISYFVFMMIPQTHDESEKNKSNDLSTRRNPLKFELFSSSWSRASLQDAFSCRREKKNRRWWRENEWNELTVFYHFKHFPLSLCTQVNTLDTFVLQANESKWEKGKHHMVIWELWINAMQV